MTPSIDALIQIRVGQRNTCLFIPGENPECESYGNDFGGIECDSSSSSIPPPLSKKKKFVFLCSNLLLRLLDVFAPFLPAPASLDLSRGYLLNESCISFRGSGILGSTSKVITGMLCPRIRP